MVPIEVTGALFINMLLSVWWDGELIGGVSLLNELSKLNPVTTMIWRDRTILMIHYLTKGPIWVFQINQPLLCFYTTIRKKKTHDFTGLLQGTWISYHVQQPFRQFSISLQPTVSVFEVSWLWMASDWVFDSQFTYWVWWCVCDPLSVPDRKCYSLSQMHCFWNWSPVVRDQQGIGGIWTGVVGTWMTWK